MTQLFNHFFRKPITIEYPEIRPVINGRFKGRLALLKNPDGSDSCIACKTCQKVCPCGDLIQIDASKNEETKKMNLKEFTIDIGRCIFCGNCTEACPKNAIIMTDKYELANFTRESLVLDKTALTLSVKQSEEWRNIKDREWKG
jgi:NADH-quinone oxidoreductase subunit I